MKKVLIIGLLLSVLLNGNDFEKRGVMVYDNRTGLSWISKTSSEDFTWQEAIKYCKDKNLRLPYFYELKSLINYSKSYPIIRTNLIDIKDENYWSNSKRLHANSHMWLLNLNSGSDDWAEDCEYHYVLCISE